MNTPTRHRWPTFGLLSAFAVTATMTASLQAQTRNPVRSSVRTRQARGAFATRFAPSKTSYDATNAYLLAYLATAVYTHQFPQLAKSRDRRYAQRHGMTTKEYDRALSLDRDKAGRTGFFEREFARHMAPVFPRGTTFEWIYKSFPNGYDPEAMVISTPKALFVVFRGTDRVATAKTEFGYDWAEWISTDFDFRPTRVEPGLLGLAHRGFWTSLKLIRSDIMRQLDRVDRTRRKPLWITGHSLGGAHAQAFAAWTAARGRKAQGVYAFAAPHVGDAGFARQLSRTYGARLQRFDFLDDPVTMLPPYITGYRRAGVRNYFSSVKRLERAVPERGAAESVAVIQAVFGVAAPKIANAINSKTPVRVRINPSNSSFCFHHPQWYLHGCWNQLRDRGSLPSPNTFPKPHDGDEACNSKEVARSNGTPSGRSRVAKTIAEVCAALRRARRSARDACAELIKRGFAAGAVAKELASQYGAKAGEIAKHLFAAGCKDSHVARALRNSLKVGAGAAAQMFRSAKRSTARTAKMLRDTYGASARQVASDLRRARCSAGAIALSLRQHFKSSANGIAKELSGAGFSARSVAGALSKNLGCKLTQASAALAHAGCSLQDTADAMWRQTSKNAKGLRDLATALCRAFDKNLAWMMAKLATFGIK